MGLSTNAWAQSAVVRIGDVPGACTRGVGIHVLPVSIGASGPVATARFKVIASSPVTFLDPPNGEFDLSFTPCLIGGWVANLVVFVPAGSVTLSVVPATGHSEIELIDCDGYSFRTVFECETAQLIAPYRPSPPDGATDVPTNQLLSYVGEANGVKIGTSPDMASAQTICFAGDYLCAPPLSPGPLAPHTTYYWQAYSSCICGQVLTGYSEIFSFTTGDGPLAVEPATWGRVKALYRD